MPHLFQVIAYSAIAELRAEAARARLGFAWWILEPVLYMAVFYFVFGILFERGGPGFAPVLMVGIVFWRWFDSSVRTTMNSITSNANLMQQVYLPKLVFPSTTIITTAAKFVVVFLLLLVFLLALGYRPAFSWLALPLVIISQFFLNFAVGALVALVVPFIPDVRIVVQNGLTLMLFLSGIFYTAADIPDQWRPVFFLNPVAVFIESFRQILLHGAFPDWTMLGLISFFTAVALLATYRLFLRLDLVLPKL